MHYCLLYDDNKVKPLHIMLPKTSDFLQKGLIKDIFHKKFHHGNIPQPTNYSTKKIIRKIFNSQ